MEKQIDDASSIGPTLDHKQVESSHPLATQARRGLERERSGVRSYESLLESVCALDLSEAEVTMPTYLMDIRSHTSMYLQNYLAPYTNLI